MNTAGVNIGDHGVEGVEEEGDEEGEHEVYQSSEVHANPYPQPYLVQLTQKRYLLLVDYVPTAGAQFKLVSILDGGLCTLLLSSSSNLFCSARRSKLPNRFALQCYSASSIVG